MRRHGGEQVWDHTGGWALDKTQSTRDRASGAFSWTTSLAHRIQWLTSVTPPIDPRDWRAWTTLRVHAAIGAGEAAFGALKGIGALAKWVFTPFVRQMNALVHGDLATFAHPYREEDEIDFGKLWAAMKSMPGALFQAVDACAVGPAAEGGRACGALAFDVGSMVVPVGVPLKAGRVAGAWEVAGAAARADLTLTRIAEARALGLTDHEIAVLGKVNIRPTSDRFLDIARALPHWHDREQFIADMRSYGEERAIGLAAFQRGIVENAELPGAGSAGHALYAQANDARDAEVAFMLRGSEQVPLGLCFAAGTEVHLGAGRSAAIESLQVGDRVRALGDSSTPVVTAVDSTWQRVRVAMPDPAGSGDVFRIELLRPEAWLDTVRAEEGHAIHLVLPEMGVEGDADVLAIDRAPRIEPGPGHVVLSTVESTSSRVLVLRFTGTDEILEPTASHPLYSLDREQWVRAGDLRTGERLRTASGAVTIAAIEDAPSAHRVYNLEVEAEHTFLVSSLAVVSHNQEPCAAAVTPSRVDTLRQTALRLEAEALRLGEEPESAAAGMRGIRKRTASARRFAEARASADAAWRRLGFAEALERAPQDIARAKSDVTRLEGELAAQEARRVELGASVARYERAGAYDAEARGFAAIDRLEMDRLVAMRVRTADGLDRARRNTDFLRSRYAGMLARVERRELEAKGSVRNPTRGPRAKRLGELREASVAFSRAMFAERALRRAELATSRLEAKEAALGDELRRVDDQLERGVDDQPRHVDDGEEQYAVHEDDEERGHEWLTSHRVTVSNELRRAHREAVSGRATLGDLRRDLDEASGYAAHWRRWMADNDLGPRSLAPSFVRPRAEPPSGRGRQTGGRAGPISPRSFQNDTRMAIPDHDHAGIASVIRVPHELDVEKVILEIEIDHPYTSDLHVELEHNGVSTELERPDAGNPWHYELDEFSGDPGAGDWILRVADRAPQDEGHLLGWKISFRRNEE